MSTASQIGGSWLSYRKVILRVRLILSGKRIYNKHQGEVRHAISVLAKGRGIASPTAQTITGQRKSGSMRYLYLANRTASTAAAVMALSPYGCLTSSNRYNLCLVYLVYWSRRLKDDPSGRTCSSSSCKTNALITDHVSCAVVGPQRVSHWSEAPILMQVERPFLTPDFALREAA